MDRTPFTVSHDTRQTYAGYYWSKLPLWLQIVVVYVASRLLATTIMLAFAANQDDTWQTSARPGLVEFSNLWDAQWYERIATGGYPSELPRNDEGRVTENAWAFMPVYPMLVRIGMLLTGLPFGVVAMTLSLVFGLVSAFLFHRLMTTVLDRSTAMFATVLYCIAPLSPMLQVGYAESLQMCFVSALLICLVERRWALMAPLVVLASFTRPSGLAWALTLGLYFLYRWWRLRRDGLEFPRRDVVALLGLGALSVLAGFGWLLVAWLVTGDFHAYLDTELAWRAHYTGPGELVPFTAWYHAGEFWIGGVAGIVTVTVVLLAMAVLLALPIMRRLGIEIRLWLVSYVLYLVAVFFPQSSVFRLFMPIFPVLGVLALPRSPLVRVLLVAGSIVGQLVWITWCWYVIGHDWTPP
ncbi:mannosyltransferase family protein [Pseudoclavibacter chungangensis]|uniref:mannosyltransferase family protein n=1 Tax=Pseudoclavibacter chungangensis TaxID=587635 RepID=UPI001788748E|nr:mannosyltransferase family protein [Pseudoclavibacter chungangensis]